MKTQLQNLYTSYQSRFINLTDEFSNEVIHGPLLMSPNQLYQSQKRKLMVVGQETNGWSQIPNDILKTMTEYEKFNLGSNYSSPFWNITRKLEQALDIEHCSCAWSNINKFDVNASRPKGDVLLQIMQFDEILPYEIEIIQPTFIVFFTGPSFDERLCKLFKDIRFSTVDGFTEKTLSKLTHPMLPKETYRTYHPKYLRIKRIEPNFIDYFKKQ